MQDWHLPETFRSTSGVVRWAALGDAGRDPVVLLHGTPFSSYVWRAVHGLRYRALALVDPVALAPWGSPFFRLVGEHPEVFEELPPALHRALVREYVSSASSPGLHPAVLDRLIEPWLGDLGQPAFYRQIAQADQRCTDEVQDRYGEIGIPTLVCWGEDDAWIPVAEGRELAARIPGARLEPIAGAGHLVQEDAPAELTAVLADFLQKPG